MKILAIDTSCDETSAAVVQDDRITSNILSSQIQFHREWGGVVPSLAKRKHQEMIDLVIELALKRAKKKIEEIDAFAVTKGPGLAVALEVGIKKAKQLALDYKKPLIPINHMEGHLYSALSKNSKGKPEIKYNFPLLALLISGGHTELVLMFDHGKYQIIGRTLDDALGECFDKVGRMLDMGYPAGPVLEKIAEKGDENRFILPIPMQKSGDANMSYSGLKTATMKLINEMIKNPLNIYAKKFANSSKSKTVLKIQQRNTNQSRNQSSNFQLIADISASFQKAAIEQVLLKTKYALEKLEKDKIIIKDLIIAGGVSQNKYLRKKFRKVFAKKLNILYPRNKKLFTDNAGMIGVAAYYNALRRNFIYDKSNIINIDRDPNWRIDEI